MARQKSNYTVIYCDHDQEVPQNLIHVLRTNKHIGSHLDVGKRSGDVISLAVPTKLLKKAIRDYHDDNAVVTALKMYPLQLYDLIPPKPFMLIGFSNSLRCGVTHTGAEYVNATKMEIDTGELPAESTIEENIRRLKTLARYIPASLVGGALAGLLWAGVKTARVSVPMMEKEADQTKRMLDSDKGLDDVIKERSGNSSTKHRDQLDEQRNNPTGRQP